MISFQAAYWNISRYFSRNKFYTSFLLEMRQFHDIMSSLFRFFEEHKILQHFVVKVECHEIVFPYNLLVFSPGSSTKYINSLCTTSNITICDRVWDCEQKKIPDYSEDINESTKWFFSVNSHWNPVFPRMCFVQTSLTQNCLKITIPGFFYNLLPLSCGEIGYFKKIPGLVLTWKSGLKVPFLPLGPCCPLKTILLRVLGRVWKPTEDINCRLVHFLKI